ncbi:MAG: Fe-S cluster assembly protein SufE [Rhodospirillaceae bacterium]|nr:Fe-S cluster assembly protein SufE [Rhodospirillaceae bacterium]|tara:strand:- start:599 stop:1054 length:456 start_codon:yes stop_codon:yes gene_type:complete
MQTNKILESDVSILDEQNNVIEEFDLFDEWTDKYEYLIDLGKKLPEFPEEYRRDEFKLKGCQSQVWLVGKMVEGRLVFQAISDAAIVSGLIALLLRIYSNRSPKEILASDLSCLNKIGLETHLSPTRKNGLSSMLEAILNRAQLELQGNEN